MNKYILLLLVLAFALMCACGNSPEPVPTPSPELEMPTPTPLEETPSPSPAPTAVPEAYPEIEISYLDTELVRIADFAPDIFVELRYAGANNFTGQVIYNFSDAYIRYGTLKKLMNVQQSLSEQGYSLLIWDAYRPVQAQFVLWDVVPDATFVANPHTGYSSHSNGGTLDLCIVLSDGTAIEMPSAFDEFNALADRVYNDVSETAAENVAILEQAMYAAGFNGYESEWWHYSDSDTYPFEDLKNISLPAVYTPYYTAECDEYINLRRAPDYAAESIARIPSGDETKLLAWCGDFAHVQYGNLHGYVAAAYIKALVKDE